MRKQIGRILAVILAVMMTGTSIPVNASASGAQQTVEDIEEISVMPETTSVSVDESIVTEEGIGISEDIFDVSDETVAESEELIRDNYVMSLNQEQTNAVTFNTTRATVYECTRFDEVWGEGDVYTYYETHDEVIETLYVTEGFTLRFAVKVEGSLASVYVSTDGTDAGRLEAEGYTDLGMQVFNITPTEDMVLTVKSLPKTIELKQFDTLDDLTVVPSEGEVVIAEDKKSIDVYDEMSIIFRFKPTQGVLYNAYHTYETLGIYEDENGEYVEGFMDIDENVELTEDADGYYTGTAPVTSFTKSVTINHGESNAVSFNTTRARVYESYMFTEEWEDGEIHTLYGELDEIIGRKYVAKDSTLYFAVEVEGSLASAYVSTDGTDVGKLEVEGYSADTGKEVFRVTPAEDMVLIIEPMPKTIAFEQFDTLDDLTVISSYEEAVIAEDMQSITSYEETTVTIRFRPREDIFYNAYCTYGEADECETVDLTRDEDGYYICTVPINKSTKSITINQRQTNVVSFDTTRAKVYECDKQVEDDGNGNVDTYYEIGDEINDIKYIEEGSSFYFAVETERSLTSAYVSTDGTDAVKLEAEGYSDDGKAVFSYTPTEDVLFTVKEMPKLIDIQYENELEDFLVTADAESIVYSKEAKQLQAYNDSEVQFRFKPDENRFYTVYYTYAEWMEKTDENGEPIYNPDKGDYEYEWHYFDVVVDPRIDEEGYYNYSVNVDHNTVALTIENPMLRNVKFVSKSGHAHVYHMEDTYVTEAMAPEGKPYAIWITVDENYALKYVTTTGDMTGRIEPIGSNDSGDLLYEIIPQGDMTVTLVDVPNERYISFNNESANMSYSVKTDEIVSAGENGTYIVNHNAQTIDFTVTTMAADVDPGVTYLDEQGNVVSVAYGEKTVAADGNRTYEYSVVLDEQSYPTVFTVQETIAQYDIVVSYEKNNIADITARTGAGEIEPLATLSEDGKLLFRVKRGQKLNFSVKASDICKIKQIVTTQGDRVITKNMRASTLRFTVSATTDTQVQITSEAQTRIVLEQIMSDGTSREVENQMKSLPLTPTTKCALGEGAYVARLIGKDDNAIEISDVNVSARYLSNYVKLSDDRTAIEIDAKGMVTEGNRNRVTSIRINIKDIDGQRGIINLTISPNPENVELRGVTENGSLDIEVDTIRSLSVKARNIRKLSDTVGVEVNIAENMPDDVITITLTGNNLRILTSADTPAENVAVVRLYNKNMLPTDEGYYVEGGTFTVNTIRPVALENGQPDVKFESADDRAITVSVKEPAGVKRSHKGKQYYKVVVTPKITEGEAIPESILEVTVNPYYFERVVPDFSYIEDVEELQAAEEAYRQSFTLDVNNVPYGCGRQWKYDVAVSLVQTTDATDINAENETELVAYRSKDTTITDVATVTPVFETKLGVKKKITKVYTNQKDVVAGILSFSAATTNKDVLVKDVTECSSSEKLQVAVVNNEILVSADSVTKLGQHTIEIAPMGPEGMYQSAKTLTVTVEKGIESLALQIPSYHMYKADKKTASMTVKAVYNPDDTTPKTKKVAWEIMDEFGEALSEDDERYGMITINKSGKISVHKELDVSADVVFTVKATAADYVGNETSVVSNVITVSSLVQEIETIVVVKENPVTYHYDVIANDGSKVTSDELKGAEVVALKKGTPVKETYSVTELETYKLSTEEVGFKTSNKAVKPITEEGKVTLDVTKPTNKVKLTATTTDGGKKSFSIKLDVVYLTTVELGIGMYQNGESLAQMDTKDVSYVGTVNTVVTLVLNQKVDKDSDWEEVNGFTNHTISVKNAKILSSDKELGIYDIIVTKDSAVITLQDKTNKVKKQYRLVNNAYSQTKAPKVKVGSKLKVATEEKQTVEFTLPDNFDTTGKNVLVELEATSKVKKADVYSLLESACSQLGTPIAIQDKKFRLDFKGIAIPKGSYKLTATIGTIGNDGIFVASVKPVTVTVKVDKPKVTKGSFTLTTSYKMDKKAGEFVVFKAKSKNLVDVEYTSLYNANVKGDTNDFMDYFEIRGDKLVLKESLSDKDLAFITSSEGKTDCSGYITYNVWFGDDGYGNPYTQTKTVKITVKF